MAAPELALKFILETKLRPPRQEGADIRRPKLLVKLDKGRNLPLTLVSAPAGYGKTWTVVSWLKQIDEPYVWLSLDEDDADLVRFVSYLVAAFQHTFAESLQNTHAILRSNNLPDPANLAEIFLYDLESLQGPFLLLLDDYHLVESQAGQAFMARLVRGLPPQLRLVLITRRDPVLPLARLRVRGQISEIRNRDLRFSLAETEALLRATVDESVGSEIVALLHERTEGWAAGLQLSTVLLRIATDQQLFAKRFAQSTHQWVMDYLLTEVMDELADTQRTRLLETAVVDQFSASLLEAIIMPAIEPGEGAELIRSLRDANLFLVPLDDEGIWYRFHHLFRELLRRRLQQELPPDTLTEIHRRAATWFADRGMIDDAIDQMLAAGDEIRAAQLIESNASQTFDAEEWRLVESWLAKLPPTVTDRPIILIAQAFIQHFRYRLEAIAPLLDRAEAALRDEAVANMYSEAARDHWQLGVHFLRAGDAHYHGRSQECIDHARIVLQNQKDRQRFFDSGADFFYIFGLQQAGRLAEADAYGAQQLNTRAGPGTLRTCRILFGLIASHYYAGDARGLLHFASTYVEASKTLAGKINTGWAHFLRGWALYQVNDLHGAEQDFRAALQIRYMVHMRAAVDSYTGLALTLMAKGEPEASRETIQGLQKFVKELGLEDLGPLADSLALRLDLLLGRRTQIPAPIDLMHQFSGHLWELPALTTVRAVIHHGDTRRFAEASDILSTYLERSTNLHIDRRTIEVRLLRTLLFVAQQEPEAALDELERALRLGESGGIIRTFVEPGEALRPWLQKLQDRGVAQSFIQQIFDASAVETGTLQAAGTTVGLSRTEELCVSLTYREMDVLLLLNRRKTNQEIADTLTVSLGTVKKHTNNIFRKLGVSNRRQAIAYARSVGIVSNDVH